MRQIQENYQKPDTISYLIQEQMVFERKREENAQYIRRAETKQQAAQDNALLSIMENEGGLTKVSNKLNAGDSKPELAKPTTSFNGLRNEDTENNGSNQDGRTLSLIAIIGIVMAAEAKASSNFWLNSFKQATESMMMQVKFAPIIADAVKSAYDMQSQATQAQADEAYWEGVVSLGTFAVSTVGGALAPVKEPAAPELKPQTFQDDAAALAKNATNTTQNLAQQETSTVSNIAEEGSNTFKSRAKNMYEAVSAKGSAIKKIIAPRVDNAIKYTQAADLASRGFVSLFIKSPYESKRANFQQLEGQAQALSKGCEQYSQFWSQSFSLSDDLARGAQQFIDTMMNILKSASDTQTQATMSMFSKS